MQSPYSHQNHYHASDDSEPAGQEIRIPEMQSALYKLNSARQALPSPTADSPLRMRSTMVLIRALLTRSHVCIIQGDLNRAEHFVSEAYKCLERLKDKSIGGKIDHLQQLTEQYRRSEYGRPRRNSSPHKKRARRPPPIQIRAQGRNSEGDMPTPPVATQDSLYHRLMNNVQDGVPSPSRRTSRTRSGMTMSDEEASKFRGFAAGLVAAAEQNSQATSPVDTAPPEISPGLVSATFARLVNGSPRKTRPSAQVARRKATHIPSGGIDMFYRHKYKDLPYSPNIKDIQTPQSEIHEHRTEKWSHALPAPTGFTDPWRSSTPRSSYSSNLSKLDHIPTPTELQAPRAGRPFVSDLASPIHRPSHPPPDLSNQVSSLPRRHDPASLSSSNDSIQPGRRTSSEDIEPETTDGPALPKLLTSIQPNPHAEHSTTSPTERVRRLSIEDGHVVPTRRPSLTIPFNINSNEKTAASTPSPLRQSFSASDIDSDSHVRRNPHSDNESTTNNPSPTTETAVPQSYPSSKGSSPELSPKSIPPPKSASIASPRASRIPIRTPTAPNRFSTGTTLSEDIRREEKREVERKRREALIEERLKKGEHVPACLGRKKKAMVFR